MGQYDGMQGMQGVDGHQGVQGDQGYQGVQGVDGHQGVQGVDGVPSGGGVHPIPAACCVEWAGACYEVPFLDYWVLEAACVDMMNGTIHMYKTCADKPCG